MSEFERQALIVSFEETATYTEVYGFVGSQGLVFLEGQLLRPKHKESDTVLLFMHPATTLNLLPMPTAMAEAGLHVMCCGSRYAKNDSALIMEKVLADLGAYIRYAREELGYRNVVLVGWSGGGSLSILYQAQAQNPTITATPAGEPFDIAAANLTAADGLISIAAHLSRAETLTEWMDPSVIDELDPDNRELELDLYNPANPNQAPYSEAYLSRFRSAQIERNRRISHWAKQQLQELRARETGEYERAFVVHRTMADPRWLDPTVDPNDRTPYGCYLGNPATVNVGPVGIARFSTLRSWLSQWSYDDSNASTAANAGSITVPALVVENSADDATPASHPRKIFELLGSKDKEFYRVEGATHYYKGQPELLAEALGKCQDWLARKGFE